MGDDAPVIRAELIANQLDDRAAHGGNLLRVSFDGALETLGPFDYELVDQKQITVRRDWLHWARALSAAEPVDIMTAEVTAPDRTWCSKAHTSSAFDVNSVPLSTVMSAG